MNKTEIRTELSSGNILIRRARLEDKEQLYQAVKDSLNDLGAWMPWAHSKYSRTDSEDFLVTNVLNWEEGLEYNFLVFDKSSYRLLGGCGLNKIDVSNKVANLIYDGLWFSPLFNSLMAFVDSVQEPVTGEVTVELYKGTIKTLSRNSPYSLYKEDLATYTSSDKFNHKASEGFIHIYGLPYKVYSQVHNSVEKKVNQD